MKKILCFCIFLGSFYLPQAQETDSVGEPFVLGRTVRMYSKILSEQRVLNIYLPDGYAANDTTRYPVIYLLDGSRDEDFIHIAGAIQFLTFPWVDSMPGSILVGIANTDRRRDFTFNTTIIKDRQDFPTTGKSAAFIAFIEKELQPMIERSFRTTKSKTIVGQSLGGLLATEILFKKPTLFNKYLIVSPSLWWDNESLLNQKALVAEPGFNDSISVYVATGNEGDRATADLERLKGILTNSKKKNINVYIKQFTGENHATVLHKAAYEGFIFLNR